MKVTNLTNEQLDYWTAKAQGWNEMVLKDGEKVWTNILRIAPEGFIPMWKFRPSTNWQQAGELMEKFNNIPWHEKWDKAFVSEWEKSPQRAICIAVITSVFGEEINESNRIIQ